MLFQAHKNGVKSVSLRTLEYDSTYMLLLS